MPTEDAHEHGRRRGDDGPDVAQDERAPGAFQIECLRTSDLARKPARGEIENLRCPRAAFNRRADRQNHERALQFVERVMVARAAA